MLRRAAKKRTKLLADGDKDPSQKNKMLRKDRVSKFHTLGMPIETKDKSEELLEKMVLGDESGLIEKLDGDNRREFEGAEMKSRGVLDQNKPAWVDEDDANVVVRLERREHQEIKLVDEKTLSGDKLQQRLQNHFAKLSGNAPNWAALKSERSQKSDEDSDSEEEDLLKHTGNYLGTSTKLPRETIQLKKCTNANREKVTAGKVQSVEFHPGAQVILTAGFDYALNLFQVDGKSNPKIQSIFVENFPIYTAHFTADGEQVVMSSSKKWFYIYDMIEGKVVKVPYIKGIEDNSLTKFKVSPDGRHLVFLGKYGYMHLVSAKSREWISSLKMNGSVEALDFSSDGSRLFSHGDDGQVYVWDMNSRDCIHRFSDSGCIQGTSIALSRNGHYLACGSDSGVVNLYQTDHCMNSAEPKPLKSLMNLTTPVTATKFNQANEILALASSYSEKGVKMVHLPSLTVFSNFPDQRDAGFRNPVCLDFSPRSGYFSVGNSKGQALLYRLKHYAES